MNVVFWSSVPGMSAVSGSLVATALAAAVQHQVRCSVMQLHRNLNGLMHALIQTRDAEDISNFENVGIDALIRIASGGSPEEGEVENVAFSFVGRRLNIYSETSRKSEVVYKNDLIPQIPEIFSILGSSYKMNFVDVPAGINAYSMAALEYADAVVACLPQSKIVVEDFFKNYQFDPQKLFIMLGNNSRGSAINVKNVQHYFRKKVKPGRCLSIPHCVEFSNAMNNSRAISFYIANEKCKPGDNCYQFIQQSEGAARALLEYESARR